jgi:hypothetical protein
METDTDANVFVAYLFEDKVQTIFVQQADVRLIEDLDDRHLYFEVSPSLSKDRRS